MSKIIMLQLPDALAEKIKRMAERKGLGVSTAIREMICEQLTPPVQPATHFKHVVSVAYILKGLQNMHVYVFVFADSNIEFLLITYFLYHMFRLFIL